MTPSKPKQKRAPKVRMPKSSIHHPDKLPAYLTPEELVAYFPEDLYYDNYLRAIPSFSQKLLAKILTERCGYGKEVTTNNLNQRELRACKKAAGEPGVTLQTYKALQTTELRPESARAAEEAETRYERLMLANVYRSQLALHQSLAAMYVYLQRVESKTDIMKKIRHLAEQYVVADEGKKRASGCCMARVVV